VFKGKFPAQANRSRCPPASKYRNSGTAHCTLRHTWGTLHPQAYMGHIVCSYRLICGTVRDCRTFTMFDLLAITQAFLVNVRLLQSFGRPSDPVSVQAVAGTAKLGWNAYI